jgi:hypothetical protein
LLAQARPTKRDPFREPEVIWGTVGLMVTLLVGAYVIWVVDRWRKKSTVTTDAKEELTDFRAMYERGEITQEEYSRLRLKVSDRVKSPAQAASDAGTQGNDPGPPPAPPPLAGDVNEPDGR